MHPQPIFEHSLNSRYYAVFSVLHPGASLQHVYEVGIITIPILQMMNAQCHTHQQQWTWHNSVMPALQSEGLSQAMTQLRKIFIIASQVLPHIVFFFCNIYFYLFI